MNTNSSSFIEDNLGLVHSCAHRFKGRGIEYEELYSAGCMGLVKAAKGFDESRGFAFSTYAVPVILGEIKRLFRDGGTIKVSRSLKELSVKVTRLRDEMTAGGHNPHISDLAVALGISEPEVSEAIAVGMPAISLTSSDENGSEFDIPVNAPEDRLIDLLTLKKSLGELNSKDRRLIILRYWGLKTQSQTAQLLGMTQVQVSRREKKILDELRKSMTDEPETFKTKRTRRKNE